MVLLNLDKSLGISQHLQFHILSSLKIVLNQKNSGPKNMPFSQLHFFTRDDDQYKHITFTALSTTKNIFFRRTQITSYICPVDIAKFLRTAFLYTSRSSRLQMFFKIGAFKSFAKFTGKHLCWSLFLKKLAGSRPATLLKRLQHRCFPVRFTKLLKTPFL